MHKERRYEFQHGVYEEMNKGQQEATVSLKGYDGNVAQNVAKRSGERTNQ